MIRSLRTLAALALASVCLVGCGRPFDVKSAPGFVALGKDDKDDAFAWRATTPEGVVVAVRVVEDESRGDLGFWSEAVTVQLRDVSGYALVETAETVSKDGTKGKLLKFGHDQDGKPYAYWVSIFQAQGRLFVVEAGGQKDQVERSKPGLEWTMKTLGVRCPHFLAPVLASNTCNRW